MKHHQPRLRIFAGPNGSGKSTMKKLLQKKWLGVYVNADDIEKNFKTKKYINFDDFNLIIDASCFFDFLSQSDFSKRYSLFDDLNQDDFSGNCLYLKNININSYHASVIADFIRYQLVQEKYDLSFETVMSGKDKIDFLWYAKSQGYRVYLYFIATEAVEINIDRVRMRVETGGHDVPIDKIKERYIRSLNNLKPAIACCNRAYIFDNSASQSIYVAEFDGDVSKTFQFKVDDIPAWFDAVYQTMP